MSRYPALAKSGFVMENGVKISASVPRGPYEAASQTRRARGWTNSSAGPNAVLRQGVETIRRRARDAVRNDPWASNGLEQLVSDTVGSGIRPRSEVEDKATRKMIQDAWRDSIDEFDADGQFSFYGQQALIVRTQCEGGECFTRLRNRRPQDGLNVPLQVQVFEPEHIPVEKNEKLSNGNVIIGGVEFNAIGQRVAYWMYRSHPGDGAAQLRRDIGLPVRVPAEDIIHCYVPLRPGQVRATPEFVQSMLKLYGMDRWDDAVMFRQEIANLFAGFITMEEGSNDVDPFTGDALEDGEDIPEPEFEPGTLQRLGDGESITFPSVPDAGSSYKDFSRSQKEAIAAGFGLPYELLSGDFQGVNDRVMRVILTGYRRRIRQRQQMFVFQHCRGVWQRWMDMAVLSGRLELPEYETRRREYQRVRWVGEGWDYIHPVQDVQADENAIKAGLTSRTEAVTKRGGDVERIDEENAQDNERADDKGVSYTSDGRNATKASTPSAQVSDSDDDDDLDEEERQVKEEETALRRALLNEFNGEQLIA